jgi:hypothetical protein
LRAGRKIAQLHPSETNDSKQDGGTQMAASFLLVALASGFSLFPGFLDPNLTVQAISDKGPILELIISCHPGEGIISVSKVDRLVCIPDASCYATIPEAVDHLCK